MTRVTYVQVGKEFYVKGTEPSRGGPQNHGPAVIGDEGEFRSPVDGQVYSGRAGMREHCARNDVVSNRDLTGLPTLTTNSDFRTVAEKRADAAARKQLVINAVNKHYR